MNDLIDKLKNYVQKFNSMDEECYFNDIKNADAFSWMKENRARVKEIIKIKSFDGLILYGEYYECKKGAPVEILFNGYRGDPERDMSGAVERCFALNHNVILACQRACGKSEGSVVTFGVKESRDCLTWIDYAIKKFGEEVNIIIGGVSMGGSTVLMTASKNLPKNVKYVLCDCGFSSQKDIIKKVIKTDCKLCYTSLIF